MHSGSAVVVPLVSSLSSASRSVSGLLWIVSRMIC